MQSRRIDGDLSGLRDETDEGLYDWLLFAEGRPNRVKVSEVLSGAETLRVFLPRGPIGVALEPTSVDPSS